LLLSLSPPLKADSSLPDYGLRGSGAAMAELRRQIRRIACSDLDVLLRGETGTGKEVVAHAIHRASDRARDPMVSVNVAAIPGSLAPAALFGSSRGAFTGADRARPGYFQQASGGTLFLDEIGDAPEEVQPQLLRVLQQREIQPVGGEIQRVDVRVISATDVELDGESAGFKSALRHRLGALEVSLPALRDHREDIGELLAHYLGAALARHGRGELLPGQSAREIASCAALFYQAACCDWPGNVRQLVNVCNQVAIASEDELQVPASVSALLGSAMLTPLGGTQYSELSIEGAEYRSIQEIVDEDFDRAMQDSNYEVAGVAQRLGVSRQSVYRRMASSGVYRKAADLSESELLDAVRDCGGDTRAAAKLLRVSASGLRYRVRAGLHDRVDGF
jgi:DNA-binding NtrC family response regulator